MSLEPTLPTGSTASTLGDIHPQPVSGWRANPERAAWIVLLGAFLVFLALALILPRAIRYGVRYANVAESATINPTLGTVLLFPPRAEQPIAITTPRDDVVEGSRIETTGNTTQGVLGLTVMASSQESMGTVHIYPHTTLDVLRIRRPRFAPSPEPYFVRLRLREGRIRLLTNASDQRPLIVEVETPHGMSRLREGSYSFTVSAQQSELSVRQGEAQVQHPDGAVQVVGSGLRTTLSEGEVPAAPEPAQRDLIENGDFSRPLLETWQPYTEAEQSVIPGVVKPEQLEGRRVARFLRQGEENIHTEVGIRQEIDRNVNAYDSLRLKLDVRLIRQSLPGAGYVSTEFPLRVEIDYTDVYGKDEKWGHGFYYQPPPAEWPLRGGQMISQFVWYSYESPNLVELLGEQGTPPAHVNGIRIYASGWNYESMVSEISLVAE